MSSRVLFLLAMITWLTVGIFLLTYGIQLELACLHSPPLANAPFSLLAYLMSTIQNSKENCLFLLLCLALFIGYLKGKFVLKKTATKQINHILALSPPYRLTMLYTKKYLLLIVAMMLLGMLLRFLPIHSDVRGFIDIAIGAALINGATHYFPHIIRKTT